MPVKYAHTAAAMNNINSFGLLLKNYKTELVIIAVVLFICIIAVAKLLNNNKMEELHADINLPERK